MPKDESFLLLSLSDSKAKKIAQVVNNESCRKILDYLAKTKDATETKIAEDMKIPLPTVHYNLKQLVDVKLVNIDEFHYSEKGKEVNHYTLANKYIIIAPKDSPSILEKLKKILPAFSVVIAGAFLIKAFEWFQARAIESAPQAKMMVAYDAAPMMLGASAQETAKVTAYSPGIASWFFLGGLCAILVYFIVDWLKDKK